jgi:hypothetical protein
MLPSLKTYSIFAVTKAKLAVPSDSISLNLQRLPEQLEDKVTALMDLESATHQTPEEELRPLFASEKCLRCIKTLQWDFAQVYYDQARKDDPDCLYGCKLDNAFRDNQEVAALKFLFRNNVDFSKNDLFTQIRQLAIQYGKIDVLNWLSPRYGELPIQQSLLKSVIQLQPASVKYFLEQTQDPEVVRAVLKSYTYATSHMENNMSYYVVTMHSSAESLQLDEQQFLTRTDQIRGLLQTKLDALTSAESATTSAVSPASHS